MTPSSSAHPPRLETFLRSLTLRDSALILHLLRCRACGALASHFLGSVAKGEPPLWREGVILSELPDFHRIWPGLEATLRIEAHQLATERTAALELETALFALPEAERTQAIHDDPRFRSLALGLGLLEAPPNASSDDRQERALLAIAIADLLVERQGAQATRVALRSAAGLALAEVLRETGSLVQAEIELNAAAIHLEASADPLDRARYSLSLGLLRRDQQRPEEAFALLERAALLFAEIGETRRQASALLSLGDLHLELADSRAAFNSYDGALGLLERDEGSEGAVLLRAAQGAAISLVLLERGDEAIETLSAIANRVANPKDGLRLRDLQARIELSRLRFPEAATLLRTVPEAWVAAEEPLAAARSAVLLAQALLEGPLPPEDTGVVFADLVEILERLAQEPLFSEEIQTDLWKLTEALVDRTRPPAFLRQIAETLDRLRSVPSRPQSVPSTQEPS